MSVLDYTPHLLSFLTIEDGYEDGNGDWHEGTENWSEPVKCHAVASGSANQIAYDDGTTATYSYTIGRLSPSLHEVKVGDKVKLIISNSEKEYTVKGFHRYQFQSKIWV